MLKRKTNEEFLQECEEKGILNKIKILEPYEKSNEKLKCLCIEHQKEFFQSPRNILELKNGCPECLRLKKANLVLKDSKYFLDKCEQLGLLENYIPLESYKGVKIKIKFYCKKHSVIWESTPALFYQNLGCIECQKERRPKSRISYREFIQRFKENNNQFDIIEIIDTYKNMKTKIKCRCKIHNYIWEVIPGELTKGSGCPICGTEKRAKLRRLTNQDFDNRLHKILSQIIRLEDYKGRNIPIKFQCIECNKCFIAKPANLLNNKNCPFCGDTVSFPNKISRNLFYSLLPLENFDFEYQSNWANPYFYDIHFILNNKEYLVEIDGSFHSKPRSNSSKDLKAFENRQNCDKEKTRLAKENGIELIRIYCPYTDVEKVIEAFKNNKRLNELFDLSDFDWIECTKKATKSLIKEICDYYNLNKKLILKEIADHFKICPDTVRNYLIIGEKLGLCTYIQDNRVKNPIYNYKEIYCFDKNDNFIDKYDSIKSFIKTTGIPSASVTNVMRGKQNVCGKEKYKVRYAKDIITENGIFIPISREKLKQKYSKKEDINNEVI